jgi:hypothetical protein
VLDIHNLERRWLKYKIKTFLPIIITLIVVILLLIGAVIFWPNKKVNEAPTPLVPNNSKAAVQLPKEISTSVENSMLLEPSMEFIHSLSESSGSITPAPESGQIKNITGSQKTTVPQLPPPTAKMLDVTELPPLPKTQIPLPSNKTLTINRNESALDITELEQRFKETSNANLGLFIARYYYDHGNYSESYNYALKTNAVNSHIEESWIIFSKSLTKLGKVDQAKKTLQLYIAQSGSETAKSLLENIEKGNFK